jgi:hypothetical protein
MENVNPYNKSEFNKIFTSTGIYKKLEQDFGTKNLVWDKFVPASPEFRNAPKKFKAQTPRERVPTIFSATVFYYLLPLLEVDYDLIYDLGCGGNMFKPYIPRLIGIGNELSYYYDIKDPAWPNIKSIQDFTNLPDWIKHECLHVHKMTISDTNFYGDVYGAFDDNFVLDHQEYFQAIFSICACHFRPLHLFKKMVLDFASMVKVGGRGFLAVNLQRMIERESPQFLLQEFSTVTPTVLQYTQYIKKELSTITLNFLILDIDLTLMDESMDGNIRLVFEK